MIAHLCRLAWNRRRKYLLLVAELFLSFLVLTPLTAGWVLFAAERLKPLGFEHENVWSARLGGADLFGDDRDKSIAEHLRNVDLVGREIRALDGVQAVALASDAPLQFSSSWNGINSVRLSDEGLEALGLRLLAGRWFQPEDEALDWTPAVIDRELSQALFGGEDPLGRAISDSPMVEVENSFNPPRPDQARVVGVVESCFYYGKYQDVELPGFVFLRLSDEWLASPMQSWVVFLVNASAGSGQDLGERLRSKGREVLPAGRSLDFEVQSLTQLRQEASRHRLTTLSFIAAISGLMMLMVALGLIGIMWLNVRRRTREIGIRRAVGAPAGRIYGQFLGELAVLVTAAIALGCVPLLQLGLLDMVLGSRVPGSVAAAGVGATALVLYLGVMLCGLYPSWLAARVKPAEALHHDY
ncbi:MAG: FtsX-like permease family protein [Gemmatimonadaceae bacterium]|nr:FtsX-like permease family protein [Gemmatimonadaceae bacterium]